MRSPFDCPKYMRSCCTAIKNIGKGYKLIHSVDGRRLRSIKSKVSPRRWFHIIRLKGPHLIQRYMIVIDEDFPIEGTDIVTRKENTMRYDYTLKLCNAYLQEM